jgi:hypothetical protein
MPYIALAPLRPPGSLVAGYQPGDPVSDDVVAAWDLDDTQVREVEAGSETDIATLAAVAPALVKPGPEANRAELEAYAVAIGAMTADEASAASQDDLESVDPADDGRPTDAAVKAEWVAYVVGAGADETWANDKSTTKADLQAWKPGQVKAGDTVAQSLSEQQAANGA